MNKHTHSIKFRISLFFIVLNLLSFFLLFGLVGMRYRYSTAASLLRLHTVSANRVSEQFAEIQQRVNELTLDMYTNPRVNELCNRLTLGEYANTAERTLLEGELQAKCYDYCTGYTPLQFLGIFLADDAQTRIISASAKTNSLYWADAFTQEAYEQVQSRQGAITTFTLGPQQSLTFARMFKDFSTAFDEQRVNGAVAAGIHADEVMGILQNAINTPNTYVLMADDEGVITQATDATLTGAALERLDINFTSSLWRGPLVTRLDMDFLGQQLIIVTPARDITLSSSEFISSLVLFICILAVLNILLVIAISRSLTRPVANLVEQIKGLDMKGQYPRIHIEGQNEIVLIADTFNDMLDRVEDLLEENYAITLNEKNARIAALQSQINPHFIFNTLETLNWKTMFLEVPEVTKMISCLGEMLRYTTDHYGSFVTVEQEVAQIRNYLYIQGVRMDNSFTAYVRVDDAAKGCMLPCLLIQPLVENAILHGLLQAAKPGKLVVRIRLAGGMLHVMVFDNGKGMEPQLIQRLLSGGAKQAKAAKASSIGIGNVNRRLVLTYGPDNGLRIESKPEYYTRVEFSIPVEGGPADA